nr:hypothetical protein [Tanacetum cinerariifolium]
MADVNLNVNASAEKAPAMAPPTRTDDQILSRSRWILHCFSTIPSIYIQQFWDTIRYDRDTTRYICQLDEQWFDLTKDTLKDALQITPVNNNNPFSSPPTPYALINFFNNLGYPKVIKTLSAVVTNDMFQPWRALTMIINLCLTGKSSRFERPRAPMFQGKKKANPIVIPSTRFTKLIIRHLQSKHKFHPRPDSPLHFPYEEYILGYLKFSARGTKREVFGMPISNELITADIQGEQYYKEYLEKVAKHQRYLSGEEGSDPVSPTPKPAKATKKSKPSAPKAARVTKPATAQQPKPKPTPAKTQEKKRKLVTETSDKPSPAKSSKPSLVTKRRKPTRYLSLVDEFADEEADMKRAVEESLKSVHDAHRGLLLPMVIKEPDSGKFQLLLEVQGMGKEKVSNEHVAIDLLTLQTQKKVSPVEQYIFQRRTPAPTEPSGYAESPSIYAELDFSFGDLFFNDKPSKAENEKTTADTEVESMVSKAVDEIVTDAVDWAIQPSLRNRFRDLPEADMKDILHQRMWETNSYKAHEDHMIKKKKRHDSQKTPPGSPPHQPPHPLPPAGPSGTSGSPGSSQLPPPPPPPLSTSQSDQSKSTASPSSSKTDASAKYTAWTTTNIRLRPSVSFILEDLHMDDDTAPDEQFKLSFKKGELASIIIRHNVSKPLPLGGPPSQVIIHSDFFFNKDLKYLRYGSKGSRPALSISKMKAAYYLDVGLEQMVPDQMWIDEECKYDIAAIAVRTYMRILSLVKIEVFSMYGYDYMKKIVLHRANLNEHIIAERDFKYLYPSDFENLYLLNLQGHLNHLPPKDKKILTTAVNLWTRHLVIRQHVEDFQLGIESYQTQLNLTKPRWDAMSFEYKHDYTVIDSSRAVTFRDKYGVQMIMRHRSEGDRRAVKTHMRILSVVIIEVFSMYGYDYMKKIVLRRADLNEHIIAERDFKYLYPSEFEDLDKYEVQMIMRFNEIYKFSDDTLHQIDKALDYRVKEFKVNRMNPGLNTRFWTRKDVDRSNKFMFSIQKRLKTKRIFCNLESFVGGRLREGDYRLL